MQNIPNVHEHDRAIPAGKILIAEYAQVPAADRWVDESVLDTKTGWGRVEVRLVARQAGWTCAGSMARWDNGSYAVSWTASEGTRHGQRYRTFDEALAHFNRIPETR